MTRRLGKFMEEIEHYDPQIGYRPGRLQTVPDALSRISGQCETGDPASTDRFFEMEEGEEASDNNDSNNNNNDNNNNDNNNNDNNNSDNNNKDNKDNRDDKDKPNDTSAQSMRPRIRHDTRYFHQIARYLKAKLAEHQIEDRMKEDALNYELKEGTLYYRDTGIQVVMDNV